MNVVKPTPRNVFVMLALAACLLLLLPTPVLHAQRYAMDHTGNLSPEIHCDQSKIYDASTSGNTELVPLASGKHVFICGYEMFSAGTVNVSLVAGTGTACASAVSGTPSTGTSGASAGLTPAWEFTAQTGKLSAIPTHGWLLDAGSGNAVCLKTSAGVAVQAQIFYQQR